MVLIRRKIFQRIQSTQGQKDKHKKIYESGKAWYEAGMKEKIH